MSKSKNLSWKLCRDVIKNRPLTKEIPTSGKEVRDDSIVVLAINNPACSIITAS
jgi:hypothetical protein